MSKMFAAGALALLLVACATTPGDPRPVAAGPASAPGGPVQVAEAWISEPLEGEELDSVVTWTTAEGATWVIASAKASHRLAVFDADSGAPLRRVGGPGGTAGRFDRPNGLAAFGDVLFVVERDNRRVQLLSLPEFAPLASFGKDELRSPYGIWLHERAPEELEAFVTDSFMYGEDHDVVPPEGELSQRVRRYQLRFDDRGHLDAAYAGSFGDGEGPGRLHMVESIAGDPAHGRLMVAEEDPARPSNLHVYGFDGRWTGRSLPEDTFAGEAEGVALWACGPGSGYWVTVDQMAPRTRFHLFHRDSLEPAGSFAGTTLSGTDGIALHAAATRRFPGGALYAVHDDRAVAAFDLRDIVAALRLDDACLH